MIPIVSTFKTQVTDGKMGQSDGCSGKQLTKPVSLLICLLREARRTLTLTRQSDLMILLPCLAFERTQGKGEGFFQERELGRPRSGMAKGLASGGSGPCLIWRREDQRIPLAASAICGPVPRAQTGCGPEEACGGGHQVGGRKDTLSGWSCPWR